MSYARNILEKYGWAEGKGLGKTENGMVEALKPKLKIDNAGIGHDHAEQFTLNWWEIAFNEAAKRVSVNPSRSNSNEEMRDNYHISTKRPWVAKVMRENSLKYGKFIKTETLTSGGDLVPVEGKVGIPEDDECYRNGLSSNLSDDELFKICGGRTAHKAARHGHRLVGKLARVIEQERKHVTSSETSGNTEGGAPSEPAIEDNSAVGEWGHIRKKKKKKKRNLAELEEMDKGSELQCAANDCDILVKNSSDTVNIGDGVSGPGCKEPKRKKKKKRSKDCVEISSDHSTILKRSKKIKKNHE